MSDKVFELCEQVYAVTGWHDTLDYMFKRNGHINVDRGNNLEAAGWWWYQGIKDSTPLYTSDYLLDHLPKHIHLHSYTDGEWHAVYVQPPRLRTIQNAISIPANTHLVALLKLTLELKKENLL